MIWAFGLVIASRVRVLHITLAYILSFLVLSATRALLLHEPMLPEIAPITGPMYQLFIFFMITDPRTVVRDRRWQIAVAVIIAVAEALLRVASDHNAPLPTVVDADPALFALWIVGPIAKWIDVRSRPASDQA